MFQQSATKEGGPEKPAPVIVKLSKTDGVYKKVIPEAEVEKKPNENGHVEPVEASSDAMPETSTSATTAVTSSSHDLKAVSVTMTSAPHPDQSKKSSAYDFSDSHETIPPMRKDSPAKIIPLNGKPLKIDAPDQNKVSLSPKGPASPTKTAAGSARFSKTGKRIGRPPKKGTLLASSSLGVLTSGEEASTSEAPVGKIGRAHV